MNRMTQRHYDGLGWTVNENGRKYGGAAIDRLAAYENTGLDPEEVLKICNVMAEVAEDYNCRFDFVVRCVLEKTNEPPNTPLTLEELREMTLQEWLWVKVLISPAFRRVKSGYYQKFEDYTKGEALCAGWPGTIHEFEYADYGKTWIAYRRKPEEGTI